MPFGLTRRLVAVAMLAIWSLNLLAATRPFEVLTAAAAEPSTAGACRPPGTTGWLDEGIPSDFNVFLRPIGTLKAVMVFVDFPDAPIGEANQGWQGRQPYLELHRAGADWLYRASYGRVQVAITPSKRWYRMSQPSWTYGLDRAVTFDQHVAYLAEAVALADRDVDFAAYDIVYVVAGPNAFGVSNSPAYIDRSGSRVRADGVAIAHAATFGTDVWSWLPEDRPLVLAHETLHLFGLPDLYGFSGDPHRFVAGWDIMGDLAAATPGPLGWHRWKLGWIANQRVTCFDQPGRYTVRLTAIERDYGTKLAVIRTGPTTAYVIESRRRIGLDADACSSGVLVYRVDSTVPSGSGPIQVMDATPGDAPTALCRDLDVATYGAQRPRTFVDRAAGVTIRVLRRVGSQDVARISIAGT